MTVGTPVTAGEAARLARRLAGVGEEVEAFEPGTVPELPELPDLLGPVLERLGVVEDLAADLAAGRLTEVAAVQALRELATTQPVRGPR